mmetsp:Transcript_21952/g.60773  ORF Transcript_21952/g.60773 Transcript_21952/m.60773 type:complete len:249 (-) Transcript_21952:17-763(-)
MAPSTLFPVGSCSLSIVRMDCHLVAHLAFITMDAFTSLFLRAVTSEGKPRAKFDLCWLHWPREGNWNCAGIAVIVIFCFLGCFPGSFPAANPVKPLLQATQDALHTHFRARLSTKLLTGLPLLLSTAIPVLVIPLIIIVLPGIPILILIPFSIPLLSLSIIVVPSLPVLLLQMVRQLQGGLQGRLLFFLLLLLLVGPPPIPSTYMGLAARNWGRQCTCSWCRRGLTWRSGPGGPNVVIPATCSQGQAS